MFNRRRITAALIGLIVLVLAGWFVKDGISGDDTKSSSAPASSSAQPKPSGAAKGKVAGEESGLPVKPLTGLPSQASDTWKLITAGGPYPYPRNDDVTFQNREKVLPAKDSGYYREYTVKTPGSPDRGARRLVTGTGKELYYTEDHYKSFVVVDPSR
ncbi:ribonuclease domain-containing protein [Amycolatopsis azurea]|uniref:Guanyl-specific ribonuclease St protein n=1 Tax=Amycolatopsis azurea DSM 43854 TaxID=1238180 RepID=M2Q2N2_9PSEU|nr:ribonuclease domain-containing protein [Amycolatopsis azurea]EMD26230.1 Guanyl-specific ribonuclease St protein [Amycolatopsis azurea DSM 43854]OOC01473.1 ribonuclease N [Amycolatopsis azurea DSM 43854]